MYLEDKQGIFEKSIIWERRFIVCGFNIKMAQPEVIIYGHQKKGLLKGGNLNYYLMT